MCIEISKVNKVGTTIDHIMVVSFPAVSMTPTAITGEVVVVTDILVVTIITDEISFCQKTTTIVLIMLECEVNPVTMDPLQNTADSQMTGSHITDLIDSRVILPAILLSLGDQTA